MTPHRLTPLAAADIEDILLDTIERFGTRQQIAYEALLLRAAGLVAAEPMRLASRDRGDLRPGLRSFHVAFAARRRRAAAHILFYRPDPSGVVILRVLHESMDPAAHIGDTPP